MHLVMHLLVQVCYEVVLMFYGSVPILLLVIVLTMDGKESQSKTPMTPSDASRIQSAEAKQHGGQVEKGSFASRAQAAGEKNTKN